MFDLIAKWLCCHAAQKGSVKDFYGNEVSCMQNYSFSGTIMDVYWQFFDPFLKDYIRKEVEIIRKKAEEAKLDGAETLEIFRVNMKGAIKQIYDRMADIERLMRGNGFPDKIKVRPIEDYCTRMNWEIDEKVDAQISIYRSILQAEQQKQKSIRSWRNFFGDTGRSIFTNIATWLIILILTALWSLIIVHWKTIFDFFVEKIF